MSHLLDFVFSGHNVGVGVCKASPMVILNYEVGIITICNSYIRKKNSSLQYFYIFGMICFLMNSCEHFFLVELL